MGNVRTRSHKVSTPNKKVVAELKRIAAENGGILQPVVVVDAARSRKSVLHSRFEWNDTKAAEEYRLYQARQLIRITVQVIGDGDDETPDRVWVSLRQDRTTKDGGYRSLIDVLSDADLRRQLLDEAMQEMAYFEQKYRRLKELSGVIGAIRKVKRKLQKAA